MNANKLFSDFSLKKIWDKLLQHDKAMNSTLFILSSGNWAEQEDGTFKNTVAYATFKETDKLTVDLYDDGTLSETQLTEYEQYIDGFEIINGALVATANTKPTQTFTLVIKGDFEVDAVVGDVSQLTDSINKLGGFTPIIDETGKITGYTTSVGGADSVFPFSSDDGGKEYRVQVANRLKNTNVGITEDSSWEEIFEAMKTLFPSTFDVLAELAKADWSLTGRETFTWKQTSIVLSCGTTLGYKQAQSKSINVSNFSKLSYSWSKGDSNGTHKVQLVHSGGTLNVPAGTGTLDVSSIVGNAYFILYAKSEQYVYNATYHYSSAKTTVTTLKFSE